MLLTGLLGKTGVLVVVVVMVVVCVCVCVGGGEAISKVKGAGVTHALPRSYLHVSILLCASFRINHLCSTLAKPPRNNRKAFKGE